MQIIDVHSHLGDILYPNGGELIDKRDIPMPSSFDIVAYNESMLQRSFGIGDKLYKLVAYWATKAERARNAGATLQNMGQSLDEANIASTVCLPIAPYVTYKDLAEARKKDARILPFTSVDFSLGAGAVKQVAIDVEEGALGLKLHPIIQRKRLDDPLLFEVLQEFSKFNKPVLTHAGISHYYLGREAELNQPENAKIHYVEELVRTFPTINFIIGHAGVFQVAEVCTRLQGLSNVWVDTSFQSPEIIRKLIHTFGEDKVMYASDWPYGYRLPAIKTVKVACKGDTALEELLFYKNAARLLGLKK